jgi:hypothetical protein
MKSRVPVGHFEGDHVMVVDPDGARVRVAVFDRPEFLAERWDYRGGEHVGVFAPNGEGKSTLQYEILQQTAGPNLPALVLAPKPYDETLDLWAKKLDFPIVDTYPVPVHKRLSKQPGYVIRPKHNWHDVKADERAHREIFRRLIMSEMKKNPKKFGPRIVVVDEILGLSDLDLDDEMRAMLTRGRSGGLGAMGGSQKAAFIGTWWYDQIKHGFFGWTPDRRGLARLDEISGQDPGLVRAVVGCLPQFNFCYTRARGRVLCVVGP